MPKYIIHVGPPKTGSKYLQSLLYHFRGKLAEAGIWYPDIWWTAQNHIFHFKPVLQLRSGATAELETAFAKLNSSSHATVVLSCEGFVDLSAETLEYLRDVLIGAQPIEIVYYVRRWSERIPSDWQQEIKMGQHQTLPEFYLRLLEDPLHRTRVNYAVTLEKFAKVFGKENLKLVSHSNLRDQKVDIFKHFCREILKLDQEFDPTGVPVDDNVSPGPIDSEILRTLNYIDFIETGQLSTRMRIKYLLLRRRDALDVAPLEAVMLEELRPSGINDNAAPLHPVYAALSDYKDCLVAKEYGQEFFNRRAAKFDYVHQNYLLKDGIAETVRRLYRQIGSEKVQHPDLPQ